MSAADLNINVTADTKQAEKSAADLSKDLESIGKSATTAAAGLTKVNPALTTVQTSLAKTAVAAAKVDSTLQKSTKGIDQAGQALTNLGRVAQDAPFGFIGIQNNLNPLLESFQRLRTEAGSNIGALKALGSSLIGAGGLGLALSVVSSGILLYQKYFSDATEVTKEADTEIRKVVTSYDLFAQELEKVTAAAGVEADKVSILFSALSDSNLGLRERKGIIEQLNQISPGYLGNLDSEKASYQDIAKAVFEYTESLAKSSEIKALLPQVDKLFQGLVAAQVQLNQLRRFGSTDKNFFGLSPEDLAVEEKKLLGVISNFTKQINVAKAGLTNFAGGAASLAEILFGKTPELSVAKAVKKVKEKVEKDLRLPFNPFPLDISSATVLINKAKAEKELQAQLGNVKLKTKIEIQNDIDNSNISASPFFPSSSQYASAKYNQEEFLKQVVQSNQTAADNLRGTFDSAFVGIGEAIGESIGSGANFAETVFGNLFKVLGVGIKQLGEAMIALGTAKIVLEKFKFAPGIGTVIAGIATVAIGALLQKAIPGFANGVINFGGGLAMVGERGPELVRLPSGSDVIPNNALSNIGGGQSVIIPSITLRGQDLVVAFNRANGTINRNG